jgi:hypothetical protein
VSLADHVELVPEPRHEAERRQRRVADPVRHAQLLHARPHEVGAGGRQPRDQRERDDRGQSQSRREPDRQGSTGQGPRADVRETGRRRERDRSRGSSTLR